MASSTTRLTDLVHVARPRHWTKNIFVLAPLVFAEEGLPAKVSLALTAFEIGRAHV